MKLSLVQLTYLVLGAIANTSLITADVSPMLPLISRSILLPRAKQNKPAPKAPSARKDIMSKGLPGLKRVNSAPTQFPDPKATDLKAAEDKVKSTRRKVQVSDRVLRPAVSSMVQEHGRNFLNPLMTAGSKFKNSENILTFHKTRIEDRKELAGALYKAVGAADAAGRRDRVERNLQKAKATHAKIDTMTARADFARAASKDLYYPQMAANAQAIHQPASQVQSLRNEASKAQRDLRRLARARAATKDRYMRLRQNGGKDTDSESGSGSDSDA